MPAYLVFHIHGKRVCGMETSQCIADPRIILLRYIHWMRIERVQRASAQFENLNGCLGPALDPKLCTLAHWAPAFRIQQNGTWKEIGVPVIIEMLFYVSGKFNQTVT